MKKILSGLILISSISLSAGFGGKSLGTILTAWALHQGSGYVLDREKEGQFQLQEDVRNMTKHIHGFLEAAKSLGIKGLHKLEDEVFKKNQN